MSRECVCLCSLALPYGRVSQRQTQAFFILQLCARKGREWIFRDKKALSRTRGVWGVKTLRVKTPHEKTPRQRTRFARILYAKRTASSLPKRTRLRVRKPPRQSNCVECVSVSVRLRFFAGASYRDRHRLFLFFSFAREKVGNGFLETKRRCRAQGGCGGF